MAALDLHAAAKVAGCSRSTLKRAIKGGRISGNKEASGRWRISGPNCAASSKSSGSPTIRRSRAQSPWPAPGNDDAKNHQRF